MRTERKSFCPNSKHPKTKTKQISSFSFRSLSPRGCHSSRGKTPCLSPGLKTWWCSLDGDSHLLLLTLPLPLLLQSGRPREDGGSGSLSQTYMSSLKEIRSAVTGGRNHSTSVTLTSYLPSGVPYWYRDRQSGSDGTESRKAYRETPRLSSQ